MSESHHEPDSQALIARRPQSLLRVLLLLAVILSTMGLAGAMASCRGTMTVIEYGEPSPTPTPSPSPSAD